ncbi:unnamed protein product, partial [Linum tenue]
RGDAPGQGGGTKKRATVHGGGGDGGGDGGDGGAIWGGERKKEEGWRKIIYRYDTVAFLHHRQLSNTVSQTPADLLAASDVLILLLLAGVLPLTTEHPKTSIKQNWKRSGSGKGESLQIASPPESDGPFASIFTARLVLKSRQDLNLWEEAKGKRYLLRNFPQMHSAGRMTDNGGEGSVLGWILDCLERALPLAKVSLFVLSWCWKCEVKSLSYGFLKLQNARCGTTLLEVDEFIVGLPRSSDSKETPQSNKVRSVAGRLAARAAERGWRVYLQDEHGTTTDAMSQGLSQEYRQKQIDAYAAVMVLERYFSRSGSGTELVVPKQLDLQDKLRKGPPKDIDYYPDE